MRLCLLMGFMKGGASKHETPLKRFGKMSVLKAIFHHRNQVRGIIFFGKFDAAIILCCRLNERVVNMFSPYDMNRLI